jgi:CHASE2 domain-containing sensor protein
MSHLLPNLFQRLVKTYPNNASLFKTLWKNLFLTTLVVLSLYVLENAAVFKQIKDIAIDQMMFWHSDFEPVLADGQKIQRMALFDIDEFSYRAWDSPIITPLDKLQALIQTAIEHGAKVIAIDIGLSWTNLIEVKSAQAILSNRLAIDIADQIVFIGVTHPADRDYYHDSDFGYRNQSTL